MFRRFPLSLLIRPTTVEYARQQVLQLTILLASAMIGNCFVLGGWFRRNDLALLSFVGALLAMLSTGTLRAGRLARGHLGVVAVIYIDRVASVFLAAYPFAISAIRSTFSS